MAAGAPADAVTTSAPARRARLRDALLLAGGVAGLAACITLLYLGMRAVMDVGGSCADGGPYVSAQPCPEGAPGAMILGMFGLFGFGGLAMAGGGLVGGYGWVPILAWTGLFATLGWNFLDYGLFNPPEGQGTEWGYVIPGVLFEVMAWVPVVVLAAGRRAARSHGRTDGGPSGGANVLRGPGQPPRPAAEDGRTRPPAVPAHHRVEVVGPVRREELQAIDGLMGALVMRAAAEAPVDPERRGADGEGSEAFSEGTQALLDRLERLADLRDRGMLTSAEYETAKETVMQELEARS